MAAVQAAPVDAQVEVGSFSDIEMQLKKFLYDQNNPEVVKNTVEALERNLNVPREKIFYGFCSVVALYLVVGSCAEFLCNLIGFGYPAYASVKAIRTKTKDDDAMWLMYWMVFAGFSLLDFFAEGIMGVFPIYWLAKACVLLYLALTWARRANKPHVKDVDPLSTKLETLVVNYASGVAAKTSSGSVRTNIPTSYSTKLETRVVDYYRGAPAKIFVCEEGSSTVDKRGRPLEFLADVRATEIQLNTRCKLSSMRQAPTQNDFSRLPEIS